MKEAAEEHEHVLHEPSPILSFEGFGDNALTLKLRAYVEHRLSTITEPHKAINRELEQAGIVIAFPQRDMHLDSNGPLRVRIEDARDQTPDGK
jgi:potassium efflux system protein